MTVWPLILKILISGLVMETPKPYFVRDQDCSWKDAKTLDQYIEKLLADGKGSKDPEFECLFNLYGRDKVAGIAKRLLRLKEKGRPEDPA